jgi:hypothetical protein
VSPMGPPAVDGYVRDVGAQPTFLVSMYPRSITVVWQRVGH